MNKSIFFQLQKFHCWVSS